MSDCMRKMGMFGLSRGSATPLLTLFGPIFGRYTPCGLLMGQLSLRAFPRALISLVSFLKKEKEDKKFSSNRNSIYLIFYPGGDARHLCLALSASHIFSDFGETVGFHHFFTSYFVLHNSYMSWSKFAKSVRYLYQRENLSCLIVTNK